MAKSWVETVARAEPIAWNAALLGAKTVISFAASRGWTRLALTSAPDTADKPAADAVEERLVGRVKTSLIT